MRRLGRLAIASLWGLLAPAAAQAAPAAPAALECRNPDAVPPGQKLTLRCTLAAGTTATAVLLFYRLPGREEFTPAPTLRTGPGTYAAVLQPDELRGPALHYYFEARDAADAVVAASGYEKSPHLLLLRAPAALAAAPRPRGDENPIAVQAGARDEDVPRRRATVARRRPSAWFAGLGAGIGWGWHLTRRLEYRNDLKVESGSGAAGLPQLAPELGRQLGERWAVSAQARYQLLARAGIGDPREGEPHRRAWVVLARARRLFGARALQPFASAALGVGEGLRVNVPPVAGSDLPRNDTVRGGPVVLGPGAGILYHVIPHLALAAELRALAGTPKFVVTADAVVGVEIGF